MSSEAWWENGSAEEPKARGVAYYRHSAQERQENSIPLQRDQVRSWAQAHGIELIKEFADHGVSGLSTERREAFKQMMDSWVKKRSDFRFVLVLDVSRWGRYQDIDLSAAYAAECTRHGKQVVYTSLGLPKKDDPIHAIVVNLERYRAAQFSRELSEKVYKGAVRVTEQGFLAGGMAPYGLDRLLLDEAQRPLQVLKRGEHKLISNQRITLTPGDPKEVEVIRRIFNEFGRDGLDEYKITDGLNREEIPSPSGIRWNVLTVRAILKNESYVGTLLYNRRSEKLKTGCHLNPREEWVRAPSSFPAIVPRELFDRVQAIFEARKRPLSPDYLLERLKETQEKNGFITGPLLQSCAVPPSKFAYQKHFRGWGRAYQLLFAKVHTEVVSTVRKKLEMIARRVEEHAGFIVLDRCLTLVLQPAVPSPWGFESYWTFQPDTRPAVDLTLGIPLSAPPEPSILGYLAFPRLGVSGKTMRVFHAGDIRCEMFGHDGIEFIKELLS